MILLTLFRKYLSGVVRKDDEFGNSSILGIWIIQTIGSFDMAKHRWYSGYLIPVVSGYLTPVVFLIPDTSGIMDT